MRERIWLTIPLLFCLLLSGCLAQYIIGVPSALYMVKSTGIYQQEVEFRKFDNSIEINAQPEVVWEMLTTVDNLQEMFPWLTRINPIGGVQKLTMIGQGIEYYTLLNNKHSSGNAVITYIDPPRQVNLTLFGNFRGSQEFKLDRQNGGTLLTYTYLIEFLTKEEEGKYTEMQEKMMQARQKNVASTLKNIKDMCEGRSVTVEPYKYPPRYYHSREEPVIFEVTEGVADIDAPLDQVWNNFNNLKNFKTFFPWVAELKPAKDIEKITQVGDMVEFKEGGMGGVTGVGVVTQYIEKHRIYISLFSIVRGGQEFIFEPNDLGGTRFTYLIYHELGEGVSPDTFNKKIKADMEETLEAVKRFNEAQ